MEENPIKKEIIIPEVNVHITPVVIDDNFSLVEQTLTEKLKSVALIVGDDDIKIARATATAINKISERIKKFRIAKKKDMLVPITLFEVKANKLIELCQKSRTNLLDQVEIFTKKKEEECLVLLEKELELQYSQTSLRDEYKTVELEELKITSSIGARGTLVPRVIKTIMAKVTICIQNQNRYDSRIITLENTCKFAGLLNPLTLDDVRTIINLEENEYNFQLNTMIDREIAKQKNIKERIEQQTIQIQKDADIKRSAQFVNVATQSQTAHTVQRNTRLNHNQEFQRQTQQKSTKTYTLVLEFEAEINNEGILNNAMSKQLAKVFTKQTPSFKIYNDQKVLV